MVCGDERFEDHDPAAVGGSLKQSVCQLGHVHIHLIGAVDEIIEVFLFGSTDFMRCGLADGFADG